MYVFLFTFYLILFWTLVDFDFGYVDKNINSWIIPKKIQQFMSHRIFF